MDSPTPYVTKSCSETRAMVDDNNGTTQTLISNSNEKKNEDDEGPSASSTSTTKANKKSGASLSISQKKRRKYKPEGFPKRPLTAYNIFFMETRQKLLPMIDDNENDSEEIRLTSSMVKQIAALWKSIDKETKARLDRMAKDDLQRYEDEVRAYEESMLPSMPSTTHGLKSKSALWPSAQKKSKFKLEGFPKRPLTAYNIYFMETRQKLLSEQSDQDQHLSSDMMKHIASMWKTIDNETKERVDRIAEKDLQRYLKEVEAYEEQLRAIQAKKQSEQQTKRRQEEDREEQHEEFTLDNAAGSSSNRGGGWYRSVNVDGTRSVRAEERPRKFRSSPLGVSLSDGRDDAGVEDEIQALLRKETHALEMAARFKAQQLSLVRKLQASHPHSQVLSNLEKERATLGLQPLGMQHDESYLVKGWTRRTGERLSPVLGTGRPIWGLEPFFDHDIRSPQDCMVPTLTRHQLLEQEEMMLGRLKRLRETELLNLRGYSSVRPQGDILSELAAKRRRLLERESFVSSIMDQAADNASYGLPLTDPSPQSSRQFDQQNEARLRQAKRLRKLKPTHLPL